MRQEDLLAYIDRQEEAKYRVSFPFAASYASLICQYLSLNGWEYDAE